MIMASLIRRLRSSELVSNVLILMSGTAIAQAISWIAAPVLTRIFTPDSYGVLAVFVSLAALLSVLGTLRYDQAILLEQDEDSAGRILILCLFFSICVAALALVAGVTLSGPLGELYPDSEIIGFSIWIPLLALTMGVRTAAGMWSVRSKRFKKVASSDVLDAGCRVTVQLTAGLLGAGTAGLIGGPVVGTTAAAVFLAAYIIKGGVPGYLRHLDVRKTWLLAKRHYRFPLYSAPTAVFERFSKRSPVFLFAIFFSPVEVGYYWLASTVLVQPIRLLARSTRKAYYQRAVELSQKGKSLAPIFIKTTCAMGVFPILPMACLVLFGPQLFEFVFGAEWRRAGEYAQWLSLIPIVTLMRMPSIQLAPIYNQQGQLLAYQTAHMIARVVAIVVGALLGDDLLAIALFSISTGVVSMLIIWHFWRLVSQGAAVFSPATAPTTPEVE